MWIFEENSGFTEINARLSLAPELGIHCWTELCAAALTQSLILLARLVPALVLTVMTLACQGRVVKDLFWS